MRSTNGDANQEDNKSLELPCLKLTCPKVFSSNRSLQAHLQRIHQHELGALRLAHAARQVSALQQRSANTAEPPAPATRRGPQLVSAASSSVRYSAVLPATTFDMETGDIAAQDHDAQMETDTTAPAPSSPEPAPERTDGFQVSSTAAASAGNTFAPLTQLLNNELTPDGVENDSDDSIFQFNARSRMVAIEEVVAGSNPVHARLARFQVEAEVTDRQMDIVLELLKVRQVET
jgi:hypothetical protein